MRNPGVSKSVLFAPPRSFDVPKDESAALGAVDFARILDGNPLGGPYVGMFPAAASPWNGLGRRPGQALIIRMAATGYSASPWNSLHGGFSLAHELGHNSGFRHFRNAATCGSIPLGSDQTTNVTPGNYDGYPSGADACTLGATDLNDLATSVGFDPISWSVVPPAINGELMSYANRVWISEYNWTRLYEIYTFRPPPTTSSLRARPAAAPVGSFLLVQGSLQLTAQTAALQPLYTLPAAMLAPAILAELTEVSADLPASHPYRLQLLGGADAVLAEHRVPLQFDEDATTDEVSISRALPMIDGARALRLVHGAHVLAERSISARAPVVQIHAPTVRDGQLQLAWSASEADGDALQSTTQLSVDDGKTWQTLTVNEVVTSLSLAAAALPGGEAARVRVMVTDGARSAVSMSDAFVLPKHAPTVRITGVTDGQQMDFGSAAAVEGFGYDAEDGSLDQAGLQWSLAGPEVRAGAGGTFALSNLPPGDYALRLVGTDADGQTGAQVIEFTIRAFTVADSNTEPVLDGLCADAGYGNTPPIRWAVANGLYASARFTHANGALFVCFTGLRYGAAHTTGAVAGLRVDAGASGQALATTVGFAVNEHGEPIRVGGDGAQLVALTNPPPGFSVVILRDENTWSAEMRLENALLGGWSHRLGLVALFEDGDAATPVATWPPHADIERPSSWAASQPTPRPPEELIVNGSFENTAGTFVPDGAVLMSLPAGSSAIPGWRSINAELVWVDNANSFGAVTPHGKFSLELTGYHDRQPYGGVAQTIATLPGENYRLSFSLGSDQDRTLFLGPMSVAATAGAVSREFTFTPTGLGVQWGAFTLDFTASSSTTPISILGTRSAGGGYLGLDNVSVVLQAFELRITSIETSGQELSLSFASVPGRTYLVQGRADFGSGTWETIPGTEQTGAGGILQVQLPLPAGQGHRFYRLQELP
ncbi:MAG: DUF642 domain-containing protein [Verrucomicrobia bacterium]|nr:DUF642 domain-containing protein [Verrucomicrobiota bacterium]